MASRVVKRGSVVLIRYPFTDLSGEKVRPAIIITPDSLLPRFHDIACVFISSVIPRQPFVTDIILDPQSTPGFMKTGLKYRSVLRTHKMAVLHRSLVRRVLGELDKRMMREIDSKLCIALGLSA